MFFFIAIFQQPLSKQKLLFKGKFVTADQVVVSSNLFYRQCTAQRDYDLKRKRKKKQMNEIAQYGT